MTMVEPGLRERKKAEARAALVESALALFAEKGFDAVTVEEIAAAANVSRRTFFRYFPTKEDVVLERRREQLDLLKTVLAAAPATTSIEAVVREALAKIAADYESNRRRILSERALFTKHPSLAVRDLEIDRAFEHAVAHAVLDR